MIILNAEHHCLCILIVPLSKTYSEAFFFFSVSICFQMNLSIFKTGADCLWIAEMSWVLSSRWAIIDNYRWWSDLSGCHLLRLCRLLWNIIEVKVKCQHIGIHVLAWTNTQTCTQFVCAWQRYDYSCEEGKVESVAFLGSVAFDFYNSLY